MCWNCVVIRALLKGLRTTPAHDKLVAYQDLAAFLHVGYGHKDSDQDLADEVVVDPTRTQRMEDFLRDLPVERHRDLSWAVLKLQENLAILYAINRRVAYEQRRMSFLEQAAYEQEEGVARPDVRVTPLNQVLGELGISLMLDDDLPEPFDFGPDKSKPVS